MNAELVAIDSLIPWDGNPRNNNVAAISESIRSNGFYKQVIVQKSSNRIIAGHGRVKAAKALGLSSIPIIRLDVDDETAKQIVVDDNKTSDHATYDESALELAISSLSSLEGTGFTIEAIDEIIDSLSKAEPPPMLERTPKEHQQPKIQPTERAKPAENEVHLPLSNEQAAIIDEQINRNQFSSENESQTVLRLMKAALRRK